MPAQTIRFVDEQDAALRLVEDALHQAGCFANVLADQVVCRSVHEHALAGRDAGAVVFLEQRVRNRGFADAWRADEHHVQRIYSLPAIRFRDHRDGLDCLDLALKADVGVERVFRAFEHDVVAGNRVVLGID